MPLLSDNELAELRSAVEASFFDSCTFTRPGAGSGPEDDFGQPEAPGAATTVYDGACAARDDGEAIERERGGRTDVGGDAVLTLPYGSGPFGVDTDAGTVTFKGITRSCTIERARYLTTQVRLLVAWSSPAAAS